MEMEEVFCKVNRNSYSVQLWHAVFRAVLYFWPQIDCGSSKYGAVGENIERNS